jgi:hypothetical protein
MAKRFISEVFACDAATRSECRVVHVGGVQSEPIETLFEQSLDYALFDKLFALEGVANVNSCDVIL